MPCCVKSGNRRTPETARRGRWFLATTPQLAVRVGDNRTVKQAAAIMAAAMVVVGAARAARAQEPPFEGWVLLPVYADHGSHDADVSALAGPLEAQLEALREPVLRGVDASVVFETKHSSDTAKLTDQQIESLLRRLDEAASSLALGDQAQGEKAMQELRKLPGASDYLNRETARAARVFSACLLNAHLLQRAGRDADAQSRALDCVRSFPMAQADKRGPPAMRKLFEEAAARFAQEPHGSLTVRSTRGTTCIVRLNGLAIGTAPVTIERIMLGPAHIELECQDDPGRRHAAWIHPGANETAIDPVFDAAIRTTGGLHLQYSSTQERDERLQSDAEAIRSALNVRRLVTLSVQTQPDKKVVVKPRLVGHPELAPLAFAGVYEPGKVRTVAEALKTLSPRPPEAAQEAVSQRETGTENEARLDPGPRTGLGPQDARRWERDGEQDLAIGATLGVLGVGGIATSWVLLSQRQTLRRVGFSRLDYGPLDTYEERGTWALLSGGLGSGLLTASEFFWLPLMRRASPVPVWAWIAGGVGVAAAVGGLGLTLGKHCGPQLIDPRVHRAAGCGSPADDSTFGPLLMMQAVPLLTVPVVYALRRNSRTHTSIQASLRGDGGGLMVRGHF